ncbi:hypothetical protein, partial [Staphylococcus aureus]|uniref:hypothetical protein n=1 Tax=Staphylococcus aureus TaxID=1280 RepID=UPI001CC1EB0B
SFFFCFPPCLFLWSFPLLSPFSLLSFSFPFPSLLPRFFFSPPPSLFLSFVPLFLFFSPSSYFFPFLPFRFSPLSPSLFFFLPSFFSFPPLCSFFPSLSSLPSSFFSVCALNPGTLAFL